jgi:hypothetical protein
MPPCVPDTCQNLNPSVYVVPDGGTNTVEVQSYERYSTFTYGTCASNQLGTCNSYPDVKCGSVYIYGRPDCNNDYYWGTKSVYAGTCGGG